MSKFIEEFYCRNLDPQARSTKQNKTVQKQMEISINLLNAPWISDIIYVANFSSLFTLCKICSQTSR